jgi:transposase
MALMAAASDKDIASACRVSYACFQGWKKKLEEKGYKVTVRAKTGELVITKEVRL